MMKDHRAAIVPALGSCLLLTGALSCGDDHAHEAVHEEEEAEEPSIQVTVYSDRHELFIEYPVPSVNEAITFITHVTDHRTGAARIEDRLIFRFASPTGEPIEEVAMQPNRPGIYLPEIRFPAAGTWSMEIEIPTAEGPDRIPLPDLIVFSTHDEAHLAPIPEAPDGISFLKEQQWRLGTRLARAEEGRITERVVLPATVLAVPERRARVAPPVAGALVAAPGATALRIGREVEAGELLAYLRPPLSDHGVKLLEARAEVQRAELARELAQATRDRIAGLAREHARSQRELEEAEFALNAAKVSHEGALGVIESLRRSGVLLLDEQTGPGSSLPLFEVRAPIAGRVTRVHAAIGEYLDEERSVLEILDTRVVHVEARVRAEELERIGSFDHPILRALGARTDPVDPAGAIEISEGRLVTVGLETDPRTQTTALLFEMANEAGALRPGMALELLLPVAAPETAIALPLAALVDESGEFVVYVQLGGETFEKRYVELGVRDAERVQILTGLESGEWVVTDGAYALRLASSSNALPAHGHGH
jgi:membrane fusion protein, heavy metal efflux system